MKRIKIFFFFISLMAASSLLFAADNVVTDPGFEEDGAGTTDNWNEISDCTTGVVITGDTGLPRNGSYCARFVTSIDCLQEKGSISQNINIPTDSELTFYLRFQNSNTSSLLVKIGSTTVETFTPPSNPSDFDKYFKKSVNLSSYSGNYDLVFKSNIDGTLQRILIDDVSIIGGAFTPPSLTGDVDNTDEVTSADSTAALETMVGLTTTTTYKEAGVFNDPDWAVDPQTTTYILQALIGDWPTNRPTTP